MILVLGKARSHGVPDLGCRRNKSPGWFDVSPQNYAWNVMHEQVCCHDEAANHQLSIATAFWIIWIVSTEECSSLMQNLVQIHCCTHSVIFNATATQYMCSLTGISCPHWLVQWSCHCWHMYIPVHPPWLPGYVSVPQTVLVILTMAGLFPDRPQRPLSELAPCFPLMRDSLYFGCPIYVPPLLIGYGRVCIFLWARGLWMKRHVVKQFIEYLDARSSLHLIAQ